MNINKAITYSLLAHVRNSGKLIQGPVDVFIPLVKRTLYILNQRGVSKGENITEIKKIFDESYSIDIPIPVLSVILQKIAQETNKVDENGFHIYQDYSFWIKDYVFDEFEEQLQLSKREAETVQKYFEQFCKINNKVIKDKTSIFDFIDKNKSSLSKYLSNKVEQTKRDFTIEAQFVDFFKKIPVAYDFIKRVYLGSILSCYLEYQPENINTNIELVLDTNFIVSLLDLNTPESTHTCCKLIEVGAKQGYKFTVLIDTIEETQSLLRHKANNFDHVFLQSKINPEDIYNACVRRKLTATDLERIGDNLQSTLLAKGIYTLPNTTKYKNLAKVSSEFSALRNVRNSERAALHDAIALQYVKEKRGKRISEFEKVNCWFVHNSNSHESDFKGKDNNLMSGYQPETIKGDELLNVLWLSNPSITKNVVTEDVSEIGITSLVAFTLNESLPKTSVIKELEDNIQKYAIDEVSDSDIVLVSSRIVNRQLKNIQELNNLANLDTVAFVDRLKKEAEIQRKDELAQKEGITQLLNALQKESAALKNREIEYQNKIKSIESEESEKEEKRKSEIQRLTEKLKKEKSERLKLENKIIEEKREKYIARKIRKSKIKILVLLGICILIFLWSIIYPLYKSDWDVIKAGELAKSFKDNYVVSSLLSIISFIIGTVSAIYVLIFHNSSNNEAMKRGVKVPDDLKEIK
ncbi:MAG TPA: hypothetical protein PKE06_02085 [Flavilitoribacter sp.]|nr:hypothetical protein [Flavilitoribacter sp.]HMQ88675.1 hypothetical protein [Flavilitoribacter sp.]